MWRWCTWGTISCLAFFVVLVFLLVSFLFFIPLPPYYKKKTYDAFVKWRWLIFLCSNASSPLSDQWLITRLARKTFFSQKRKNLKFCTEWNHGADSVIMVLMHGHLWPCWLWEVFYQDDLWKMSGKWVHCLEVNCTGVAAPAGFGGGVSFNFYIQRFT